MSVISQGYREVHHAFIDIMMLIRGAASKWAGRIIVASSRLTATIITGILRVGIPSARAAAAVLKTAFSSFSAFGKAAKAAAGAVGTAVKSGLKAIKSGFQAGATAATIIGVVDVAFEIMIASPLDESFLSFIPGSGLLEMGMLIIDSLSQLFMGFRPFHTKFIWQP
jgi:hypothetical protein